MACNRGFVCLEVKLIQGSEAGQGQWNMPGIRDIYCSGRGELLSAVYVSDVRREQILS